MRTFTNPVVDLPGVDHGDPFVLRYLDRYFLYHTTDYGARGISVLQSDDLVSWTPLGVCLQPSPDRGHWAQSDLWAPEVVYEDGVFYMYVAAARLAARPPGRSPSSVADEDTRRLGIARATSPTGPFVLDARPLVDVWSIDAHPFTDEVDGSRWLFYNTRSDATRFADGTVGTGTVVDRLVAPDRPEGRPTRVAYPSERWEGNRDGTWYWNEGPWVLRRRNRLHALYSGGSYLEDTYGIGSARAEHPRGRWRKNPHNPIFHSGRRITGPGHQCVVHGPDGVTLYAVYHGYVEGERGRKIHLDRFRWAGDRPAIGAPDAPFPPAPTEGRQPVPGCGRHEAGVDGWRLDAWVRGEAMSLGGVTLPLRPGPWHRVQASQRGGHLRLWVSGMLTYAGRSSHDPAIGGACDVTAASVTSYLDDDGVWELAGGDVREWHWGGHGAVDVSLAVRGEAQVEVGDRSERVSARGVARLVALAGEDIARVRVTARSGGAQVSDVVLIAVA